MSAYHDILYQSHDGLTLYARDYPCLKGPEQPVIEQPVIMCWHGLTRNSADFEDLAQHLQKSFRVICPDQRGRGRSDYDNDSANYALPVYCRDMLTLTQHLKLSQIIVIGTSMGGLMAMGLTAFAPGLIEATVLNDIGPDIDPEGLAHIKTYVGKAPLFADWQKAATAVKITNVHAFPAYTDNDWLAFAKRVCVQTDEGVQLAYDPRIAEPIMAQDTAAAPPDLWPLFLALLEKPVLVVRAEHSNLLSRDTYEAMVKAGVNGVIVKGVGHAPMLNEIQSVRAIDSFLRGFHA